MAPITFRSVGDEDAQFLRDVYASTRADDLAILPEGFHEQFVDSQYDLQCRHYRATYPGAEWSVIEHLGMPVGRLVVEQTSRALLLVDIALLPEWRGQGIGTHCVEYLILRSKNAHCVLHLSVRSDNFAAQRLYARLGFVGIGEAGGYIRMNFVQEKRVK